jgi:redox-sensitive bicupin YhaK (pirin superfamily)
MRTKTRPAGERGKSDSGWLHARFTFSFSDYHDLNHSGFRSLKVINNDLIEPSGGFATHPHRDMEIFTYVMKGSLEHKDSMGNGSVLSAGQLQYMSAGSGVYHSEFNPSKEKQTELYQIWLEPKQNGGSPLYEEKDLNAGILRNDLNILFSGNGRNGSTVIHQDAEFSLAHLDAGKTLKLKPNPLFPFGWIQVVSGTLRAGEQQLSQADGLAIEDWNENIDLQAQTDSVLFLFHLQ